MRIWDVDPGYLDRKRLLGEHRELHGLYNIVALNKKGYSRHPETLRWAPHLAALCHRHRLLVSEMTLRGYNHQSPLPEGDPGDDCPPRWPELWIDPPHIQFELLADKQKHEDSARIPLPVNTQQLWAQHKYSLMARDPALYRVIGPEVAHGRYRDDMPGLTERLVVELRKPPAPGRLANALDHMWGYVSGEGAHKPADPLALMRETQRLAVANKVTYLLESTALSELSVQLS